MKQQLMIKLKGAACAALTVGLTLGTQGVYAGTVRSAGTVKFHYISRTLELTNIVNGAVRLTDADISAFTTRYSIRSPFYIEAIEFDNKRSGKEWGSDDILVDFVSLTLTSNFTIRAASTVSNLVAVGTNSMFTLVQNGSRGRNLVTVTNISFKCSLPLNADATRPDYGGCINYTGGWCSILDSRFEGFKARIAGGAVAARKQMQNSKIFACEFIGNAAQYGGAAYVTLDKSTRISNSTGYCISEMSIFDGNSAEYGGAVCTFPVWDRSQEVGCPPRTYGVGYASTTTPTPRAIAHGNSGPTTFKNNRAVYKGGAIYSGHSFVTRSTSVFTGNEAGLAGGAICMECVGVGYHSPAKAYNAIAGSFSDNRVVGTGGSDPAMGGAVAVLSPDFPVCVSFSEYGDMYCAAFTNNSVTAASGQQALGGAIYVCADATNTILRTPFVGNYVSADSGLGFGDAVAAVDSTTIVDTSIFDGVHTSAKTSNSMLDFTGGKTFVTNTTIRNVSAEAISANGGSLNINNCVLVGNSTGTRGDIVLGGTLSAKVAYSAYGKIRQATGSNVTLTENGNYSGCKADYVYAGDTLKLYEHSVIMNPVAYGGYVQSVTDFAGVTYGSYAAGYSMGAYETATPSNIQVGENAWAVIDKDGVCTITGTTATWGYDTAKASPLYIYDNFISRVVVSGSVTGIGAHFFDGFRTLRNVTLGATCTSIGSQAFLECWRLTNVVSTAASMNVGAHAFYSCNSLEAMAFGANPTFGDQAFSLQAGIYMKDGLPQVYAIPEITVTGYTQVLKGSMDLSEWVTVTDETKKNYNFFKIVLEKSGN